MKHLLLIHAETKPESCFSDYDQFEDLFHTSVVSFDELEGFVFEESFEGAVIVALPTWKEIKFEVLRAKFPEKKIILVSNLISEVTVRTLQYKQGSIDLFFKAPVNVTTLNQKYEAISIAQTASVNFADNDNEHDLVLETNSRENESRIEDHDDTAQEHTIDLGGKEAGDDLLGGNIDLAKELEGVEEGILGVENLHSSDEENTDELLNLLEGDDETTVYNSQDVSRILKTDLTLNEESVQHDSAEDSQSEDSHPCVNDDSPEFKNVMNYQEDDFLKLMARNELIEQENNILRHKLMTLESLANTAHVDSKKSKLRSDEEKIKFSVQKKHFDEELRLLKKQETSLKEKNEFLMKKLKLLENQNKELLKKNLIDLKHVRSREEELEDKIEFMKADFSAQIRNRESKIIELKRKIDLLDFELNDNDQREREQNERVRTLEERIYQLKKVLGESIDRLDDTEFTTLVPKVKI